MVATVFVGSQRRKDVSRRVHHGNRIHGLLQWMAMDQRMKNTIRMSCVLFMCTWYSQDYRGRPSISTNKPQCFWVLILQVPEGTQSFDLGVLQLLAGTQSLSA